MLAALGAAQIVYAQFPRVDRPDPTLTNWKWRGNLTVWLLRSYNSGHQNKENPIYAEGDKVSVSVMSFGCERQPEGVCKANVSISVIAPDGSEFIKQNFGLVKTDQTNRTRWYFHNPEVDTTVANVAGVSFVLPPNAQLGLWTLKAEFMEVGATEPLFLELSMKVAKR